MHIEIKSTRRTMIGTLRRGTIYKLDERDMRVGKVLKPMLESGAALRLTEEQAAERKADVESLELPAHVHHDPDTVDEIAEMEARLAIADEDRVALEAARDDAMARAEKAEADLAEAVAALANRSDAAQKTGKK